LGHAGWGPTARYGDFSSMMSSTGREPQHHGPLRCFNGAESDELGWFDSRSVKAKAKSHSEVVEISAFSEETSHTLRSRHIPLLVDIDESAYLVYNKASNFNADTLLFKDSVTVTVKKNGSTDMLGAVKAGGVDLTIPNFQGGNETLRIRACEHVEGENGVPDHMIVSFGYIDNLCGEEEMSTKSTSEDDIQISTPPSTVPTTPYVATTTSATHSTTQHTTETVTAVNNPMGISNSIQGTASTEKNIPQSTEDSFKVISTEATQSSDQSTPSTGVSNDGEEVTPTTTTATEERGQTTSSTTVAPCRGRHHAGCSKTEPEANDIVPADESDDEQPSGGRGRAYILREGETLWAAAGGTTKNNDNKGDGK